MGKRHQDALHIIGGACNPSGIAHAIIEACQEVRANGSAGTATVCTDTAIRLMVHQLAYITGIVVFEQDSLAYGRAMDECERLK